MDCFFFLFHFALHSIPFQTFYAGRTHPLWYVYYYTGYLTRNGMNEDILYHCNKNANSKFQASHVQSNSQSQHQLTVIQYSIVWYDMIISCLALLSLIDKVTIRYDTILLRYDIIWYIFYSIISFHCVPIKRMREREGEQVNTAQQRLHTQVL